MGTWYVDEQFRYSHSGLDTLFFLFRFFALDPQKIWRSVVRNCTGIGLGLSFLRGLNQHASSASALVWAMEAVDGHLFLNAFSNIQLRGPSGEGYFMEVGLLMLDSLGHDVLRPQSVQNRCIGEQLSCLAG